MSYELKCAVKSLIFRPPSDPPFFAYAEEESAILSAERFYPVLRFSGAGSDFTSIFEGDANSLDT